MPSNEDIGSGWELVARSESTVPLASKVTEDTIVTNEEHPHADGIGRTEIPDDLVESTPTQGHDLPIHLNSSNGIETKHHRNDEVASNFDTTNSAITANEPKDPTKVFLFKNLYTAGHFNIDVQTENGAENVPGRRQISQCS